MTINPIQRTHKTVENYYPLDFMIGQMVMVGFRGSSVEKESAILKAIRELHLGGIWLTDNESPMGYTFGNIESPQQVRQLTNELQNYAPIPLFIAIDAEGGQVIRLKEKYGFPKTYTARYLGNLDDPEFTYGESLKIARLLKNLGINFNFAPAVDLNLNPNHASLGIKERSFSADTHIVIRHADRVIQAIHDAGIFNCIKHFPGHGSARDDSHSGCVNVSNTWCEEELFVFEQLLKDNRVNAVLTAHIRIDRFDAVYPATLSDKIVNGLLRTTLGFDGVVISDDMNMGAIKQNYTYEEAIERAINGGVDIILQSNVDHYDERIAEITIGTIQNLVNQGRISENRIRQSFNRIMNLKRRLV